VPHPSVLRVRVLTLLFFLARLASAATVHPASYPNVPPSFLLSEFKFPVSNFQSPELPSNPQFSPFPAKYLTT
jgi:hypothetical protein